MSEKIYRSILGCIGSTPVVELDDALVPDGKRLLLKLDYFNPNFSIKDRTALGLVEAALESGELAPGGLVIESTSGNLGKSLCMLGAVHGFRVRIVVDRRVSPKTVAWYRAYGGEVDVVAEAEGGDFQRARLARIAQLLVQNPGAYWPNQYDNPSNPACHFETTGREIALLPVDSVVASVSTGGHLTGIGRLLRRERPDVRVVACDIEGSLVLGSSFAPYLVRGAGLSWRSTNLDLSVVDRFCIASDQEAISVCRILAREHGILVGGSGGLAVASALAWLHCSDARTCVAVVADTGANYLDEIYDDGWLDAHGVWPLERQQLRLDLAQKLFRAPQESGAP